MVARVPGGSLDLQGSRGDSKGISQGYRGLLRSSESLLLLILGLSRQFSVSVFLLQSVFPGTKITASLFIFIIFIFILILIFIIISVAILGQVHEAEGHSHQPS